MTVKFDEESIWSIRRYDCECLEDEEIEILKKFIILNRDDASVQISSNYDKATIIVDDAIYSLDDKEFVNMESNDWFIWLYDNVRCILESASKSKIDELVLYGDFFL